MPEKLRSESFLEGYEEFEKEFSSKGPQDKMLTLDGGSGPTPLY